MVVQSSYDKRREWREQVCKLVVVEEELFVVKYHLSLMMMGRRRLFRISGMGRQRSGKG